MTEEKPVSQWSRKSATTKAKLRRKHRIRQRAYVLLGRMYPADMIILEQAVEQELAAEESAQPPH